MTWCGSRSTVSLFVFSSACTCAFVGGPPTRYSTWRKRERSCAAAARLSGHPTCGFSLFFLLCWLLFFLLLLLLLLFRCCLRACLAHLLADRMSGSKSTI